jgi:alkanesulfonate monooxygenase SsuD/methylene tetrahydromethanopterin reductase-like flavin-dependent oxidoreductase (luciferase family)
VKPAVWIRFGRPTGPSAISRHRSRPINRRRSLRRRLRVPLRQPRRVRRHEGDGCHGKRTGRDATHAFVVGDADTILARIAEYVDAGVSKFILRPLGGDDEAILAQTRLLIEQVLPRAEARWPRRPKVTTTD